MSISEFLMARIEEDEAVARDAIPGPWSIDPDDPEQVMAVDGIEAARVEVEAFALSGPQTRATAGHIARHDPARVLAECEAKRRIVERFADEDALYEQIWKEVDPLDAQDWTGGALWAYARILFLLAAAHADHPDYDQEWGR